MRTLAILAIVAPALALASGGGGDAIVMVADSRRYTGLRAWWMNLYNESHFYSALLTIIIIPVLGLILGKATDLVMARIGINLKSRVLAEH